MYRYDPSEIVSDEPADDLTDEDVDALFDQSDGSWVAREEAHLRLPRADQSADADFRAMIRKRVRFEIQVGRREVVTGVAVSPELLAQLWFDA